MEKRLKLFVYMSLAGGGQNKTKIVFAPGLKLLRPQLDYWQNKILNKTKTNSRVKIALTKFDEDR